MDNIFHSFEILGPIGDDHQPFRDRRKLTVIGRTEFGFSCSNYASDFVYLPRTVAHARGQRKSAGHGNNWEPVSSFAAICRRILEFDSLIVEFVSKGYCVKPWDVVKIWWTFTLRRTCLYGFSLHSRRSINRFALLNWLTLAGLALNWICILNLLFEYCGSIAFLQVLFRLLWFLCSWRYNYEVGGTKPTVLMLLNITSIEHQLDSSLW